MKKRVISVLCLCLILYLLIINVNAIGYQSGYCGSRIGNRFNDSNISWSLNEGVLTLNGSGEMGIIIKKEDVPWNDYRDEVTKVVVSDGIETISHWAFSDMPNLEEVDLGSSVYMLCYECFARDPKLRGIRFEGAIEIWGDKVFEGTITTL